MEKRKLAIDCFICHMDPSDFMSCQSKYVDVSTEVEMDNIIQAYIDGFMDGLNKFRCDDIEKKANEYFYENYNDPFELYKEVE